MKTTIKNRGGESTLTITDDFHQVLDENFTAVCTAISNKIRILQELQHLSEENEQLADTVIQTIHSSRFPMEAVFKLQKEMNMSEMAAKCLMDWPLFDLASLNSESIQKKLAKIQKQIAIINSLFYH